MAKFADFVSNFELFKTNNNITITHKDSKRYGWRVGTEVKNDFITYADETLPETEIELKQNFHHMFEVGRELLGIQILNFIPGSKIYLLQTTEKTHTFQCEVIQLWEDAIYQKKLLKCPVTKSNFYWPIAIKQDAMTFKDSVKEYYDVSESNNGVLSYNEIKYPSKEVFLNGKVNYNTGNLSLQRLSKANDEIYDTLIINQNSSSSGSGSDSESGSSSDSGSDSGSGSESEKIIYEKDSDTVNISFITYEDPIKKIFEFDINE